LTVNPAYDPKSYVLKDIGGVGFDLWVVNSGTIFSNLYIGDSPAEADKLMQETFTKFVDKEKEAKKALDDADKAAQEATAAHRAAQETAASGSAEAENKEEL